MKRAALTPRGGAPALVAALAAVLALCGPGCHLVFPFGVQAPPDGTAAPDAAAAPDTGAAGDAPGAEAAPDVASQSQLVCTADRWCKPATLPQTADLRGVWNAGSSRALAVGAKGALVTFDGVRWTKEPQLTTAQLNAVRGGGGSAVVVGYSGTVLTGGTASWQQVSLAAPYDSAPFLAVWKAGTGEVFATSIGGLILRYAGGTWQGMPSSTGNHLYGVWGRSASDVVAVGTYCLVLRLVGGTWTQEPGVGCKNGLIALHAVWGASAGAGTQLFAVGSGGTILHQAGGTWSQMSSPTTATLYGVAGSSASDVFAVGTGGTVLHYDGMTWSALKPPTTQNLYAVDCGGPKNTVVVGQGGVILHYLPK
jgi:hypothetical protein